MKLKNAIILLVIIAAVAVASFTALNGLAIGGITLRPAMEAINQGLDLKGGVYVVYEAETNATGEELDRIISQTIEVFRRRVDAMGLTEPLVVREGNNRIRVELPGVENAQEALDMIGRTAQLQFITLDGEVVVTGSNVKKADATFIQGEGNPVVSLEFDSEGTKSFADATAKHIGEPIFIVLDEEIISSPSVKSAIPNGQAYISGNFTVETASQLAALIRGGALPVDLKEVQTSTITATLGVNALEKSITAAAVGFALVLLFMLIYYRIPGLAANIALIIYALLVLAIFVSLRATLTLPGIAALILSVGMAVDANVIIFERLKEELKAGKTIRSAIDSSFKQANRTILDANITTLIAGAVLYQFGTGPIRGFAVTLIIGIVVSMFTAIIVTKLLLKLIVGMNLTNNTKLFGA